MDFPVTRATIGQLPRWVGVMAELLPPPIAKPSGKGGFVWDHPTKSAEVVQVAKAVRMASGLRAAMILADIGHTPECGTILRTVADFAAEIFFLGEGLLEGRLTDDQQRFTDQHFAELPLTADELANREREYYVGRRAVAKAYERLFEKTGADKALHAKASAYLNKGYDSYVHGSYMTAMELFRADTMTFMMTGSLSERNRCSSKTAVAGKLVEALHALRIMAMTRGFVDLASELAAVVDRIAASGEDSGGPCAGLR